MLGQEMFVDIDFHFLSYSTNWYPTTIAKLDVFTEAPSKKIVDIEDIIQIGMLGLISAAQNYVPQKNASFASYASIRIKGEILDYLRKSSNLDRTTILIKKNSEKAINILKENNIKTHSFTQEHPSHHKSHSNSETRCTITTNEQSIERQVHVTHSLLPLFFSFHYGFSGTMYK